MVVFAVLAWLGSLCCPSRMIAVRREVLDVANVTDVLLGYGSTSGIVRFWPSVIVLPGSVPAELCFREPKLVEQDGKLSGDRDASAFGPLGLGDALAPCL